MTISFSPHCEGQIDTKAEYEANPDALESYILEKYVRICVAPGNEPGILYDPNLRMNDIKSPIIMAAFLSLEKQNLDLSQYSESFQYDYLCAIVDLEYDLMDEMNHNVSPSVLLRFLQDMPATFRQHRILTHIVIKRYENYYRIVPDLIRAFYPMNGDDVNILAERVMDDEFMNDVYSAIRKADSRLAYEISL